MRWSWPTMFSMPKRRSSWALRFLFSSSTVRWLKARSMAISSSSSISGLVRKSKAPARIASIGRFDGAVAGQQDHGRLPGRCCAAMGQHVEAVAVAQADVGQHQVVGLLVHGRDGRGEIVGRIDLESLLPQPFGHRFQDVTIVVDQQQRGAFHDSFPTFGAAGGSATGSVTFCLAEAKSIRGGGWPLKLHADPAAARSQ